ncbi:MAG: ribosome-associated translation inhibitor RaiA, partial [Clostridia bacterium]|nr:ribosome-associated translation inhibitor RaiA [Clostridia bacterium]
MKISMACRKIDLTQGMKDYAEKKLQKLDKFFDESTDAKLVFSVEKDRQKVELTIFHHNTIFRVETVTEDIYASVDKAVSDIERQIRKNKTR